MNDIVAKYYILGFARTIEMYFPKYMESKTDEISDVLMNCYRRWMNISPPKDENDAKKIDSLSIEEYMVDCTTELFPQWKKWRTVHHDVTTCKEIKGRFTYNRHTQRTVLEVDSEESAKVALHKLYTSSDVCFGEMISSVEIRGLSIEEVVSVYADMYKEIEGDEIIRKCECGETHHIGKKERKRERKSLWKREKKS